jgi:Tfp pilus assembly protein PilN
MVQFNLLPNVKLEYIKARRVKRLMTLVSLGVIGVSVGVFVIMFTTVNVVQKQVLSNLNDDIKQYSDELQGTKDIDKILTVQNQLNTLPGLHDQKPVATRLFSYLTQLTPEKVSITRLSLDFDAKTISLTGEAPSVASINTYTDTLKATKYTTTETEDDPKPAFSDVVLASFGRDDKKANYNITFGFDEAIFNSASEVQLKVPSGPTVDPAALFQAGDE